jgi:hypothetical protein
MQQSRIHTQPNEDSLKKEKENYHKLAKIYQSLIGKKKFPFAREMILECYRAASTIEDSDAMFLLGKNLLDEAKFRQEIESNGVFANSSNERQMHQLFEEALAYIIAAENLNHIEAKRLHGLCFINGWGASIDKKMGFELIVASIEQENSWDKVPQIFAAIGLNKPEFYSALVQLRNSKG